MVCGIHKSMLLIYMSMWVADKSSGFETKFISIIESAGSLLKPTPTRQSITLYPDSNAEISKPLYQSEILVNCTANQPVKGGALVNAMQAYLCLLQNTDEDWPTSFDRHVKRSSPFRQTPLYNKTLQLFLDIRFFLPVIGWLVYIRSFMPKSDSQVDNDAKNLNCLLEALAGLDIFRK